MTQTYTHFKNPLKSTTLIVRLKADKLSKLTQSGKLFHTSTTLGKEVCSHITASGFVQLVRLVVLTGANSKKII